MLAAGDAGIGVMVVETGRASPWRNRREASFRRICDPIVYGIPRKAKKEKKMSTINERIKEVIDRFFGGSTKEFADKAGVKYQTIINIIGERQSTPSSATIESIANSIAELNVEWLLLGKGEIVLPQKGRDAAPIASPNVLMVPLVGQYAQAGYLSGFAETDYMEALPQIPVMGDHELKGDYLAFEVRGDSMDDLSDESLKEGDILISRRIRPEYWQYKLHINKWDFVIVHRTEGILVKRIVEHDVETGMIRLHSLNSMYTDFSLNLRDVAQLFNVVQVTRTRRR